MHGSAAARVAEDLENPRGATRLKILYYAVIKDMSWPEATSCPRYLSQRLWISCGWSTGRESHRVREKEGGTPSGPARASDAEACNSMQQTCSLLDTTAPLLGFDEGTLGQILPRFHHRTAPTANFQAADIPTEDCKRIPLSCQVRFPCSLDTGADARSPWSAPPGQTGNDTGKIPPMSRANAAFPTEASHPAISYLQLWLLGLWIGDDPPPIP